MQASKENAQKCIDILRRGERAKELVMLTEDDAATLTEFLSAAKRKLPSAKAYQDEEQRNKLARKMLRQRAKATS
jgi:hypothetical protein